MIRGHNGLPSDNFMNDCLPSHMFSHLYEYCLMLTVLTLCGYLPSYICKHMM